MDRLRYRDNELLQMVEQGRGTIAYEKALHFLYQSHKLTMVQRLCGLKYRFSQEDALGIYHHAISILVKKILERQLKAQNLGGYLWGICQRLSLQQVDRVARNFKNREKYNKRQESPIVTNEGEQQLVDQDYQSLFQEIAKQIGDKCKTVLLLRQMQYSYREIAQQLNPKAPSSEEVMRVTAGRCKKKLIAMIEAQPKVRATIDELLNKE